MVMHIKYKIKADDFVPANLNVIQLSHYREMADNPYIPQDQRPKFFAALRLVDIDNAVIDARITVKFAIRKMMEIGG